MINNININTVTSSVKFNKCLFLNLCQLEIYLKGYKNSGNKKCPEIANYSTLVVCCRRGFLL